MDGTKLVTEVLMLMLGDLRRKVDEYPGGQRALAKELAVSAATLGRWLQPGGGITMWRFTEILLALGEEPTAWFRPGGGEPDIRASLGRPSWDTPPSLVRDLRRAARSLPTLDSVSGPSIALPTPEVAGLAVRLRYGSIRKRLAWLASLRQPGPVLAAVEALEDYRHLNLTEAESMASTLVLRVCPNLPQGATQAFCRVAGVLACAYRMRGDLPVAADILRLAILLARRSRQPALLAVLYRKAGYVLYSRMQFRAALDAADAAGRIYQDLGDEVGQAKVLADRGTFLTAAGKAEAALSELRQALAELPTKARMNRLGAYFQLSRVLTSLGEHRDAAAALGSAERLLEPGQAYYSSCLLYEQGTALAMAGEMEEAVQALRSSLQSLQGLSPSNQARVSLALIEALLQSGNQTEAVREAQGMARLLKPIAAFHPTAEGALAGLLRRAAKISVADVVATRSALSQAIAQPSLQPHLS